MEKNIKIAAPYTYTGPVTSLPTEAFITDAALAAQEIAEFIDNKYGNLLYFAPLIQELKKKKGEYGALLRQCKRIVPALSPLANTVFLYVLYLGGIFDAELMKCLIEAALQIENAELRQFLHGIFNDTSTMCFPHPEYLFPEFYNLRRSFLKKLCKMYNFKIPVQRMKRENGSKRKKICVLNHMLYDDKNAPTLLSTQISGILADLGYDVKVMSLDVYSYMAINTPIFSPAFGSRPSTAKEYRECHKKIYHPSVKIEYTDIVDVKERLQCQLDKIAAYSPDLILDMSDDFSILSDIYSKYFATLFLPMRGYQSSSCFTNLAIRSVDGFLSENDIYHAAEKECVVEFPVCIMPPEPKSQYTREMLSLESDDFVLVTVGSRLNDEIKEEFADCVCERLLAKPNIKWLIVGSPNEYLFCKYSDYIESKKIIYIPFEDDLPALYKICDLYLNPQRMGGGASITWAMHYGLPVAVLSNPNDVMPVIGKENTVHTYEQMMDYALKLWSDSSFYVSESNKFQKYELEFESKYPHMICTAIEKALTLNKFQ